MSALAELNTLLDGLKIKVETGSFKGKAPDTYTVLTPLADTDDLFADNMPQIEVQEVSISIFTKGSYTALRQKIVKALRKADFTITDNGVPDSTTGRVITGDGMATLAENGVATYRFNIAQAGTYDVAVRIGFPFWDINSIKVTLDGAIRTYTENRLWWPYWRSTCWMPLATKVTLMAGQHTITISLGSQGVQFYGFRVCSAFSQESSAGSATFTMKPRAFIDVDGNRAVPDKGFKLTTEVLRRPPESALIWYEDFRDENPLKDTYWQTLSGEWKVWRNPDSDAKRPYSQLEGSGQLAWKYDKFSDIHIRARIAFQANGTGRAGVFIGNLFCCINIANQKVELYQGSTLLGSWQGTYTRTSDASIRTSPSMYLLEMRKRGNRVRVYSGASSVQRFTATVSATTGYAGIQSDGSIKCELLRLGDAWTYEP